MNPADAIFCEELSKRGISYSLTDEEDLYTILIDDQTLTVSLVNVRRNYERDGNASSIIQLVNQIDSELFEETPPWDAVRAYVRYSLEPSDYESGFEDVLFKPISDGLNQVFVYTSPDGSQIHWILESMLADWGTTPTQLAEQAEQNMAEIVRQTQFTVDDIKGNKLGMLTTDEVAFKASLILSPAFRDLAEPTHGWPVYVVVPCRDFVYVIRQDNVDFLSLLGEVVVREYRDSGYPITKEVLEISDSGIVAIGTYPDPESV
ncbi:MAG: hypothetical protein JWM11_3793 [Planctomycetaceae bacterium]|nr:hypothetical protein [Planctomycetaceae bacterium]